MTFATAFTKPCLCPQCGDKLDAATHPSGKVHQPEKGDFSMCLNCGTVLRWNAELILYCPTEDEMMDLEADQRLMLKLMQMKRAMIVPPGGLGRKDGNA